MKRRLPQSSRRGAIAVFAAVLMVLMLAMIAFAVDLGLVAIARTELQRTADAAALAGAFRYAEDQSTVETIIDVRKECRTFAEANPVLNSPTTLSLNWFNADPNGDVVVGEVDFTNPGAPMSFGVPSTYNAVRVRVRRTSQRNGEVPVHFARIFGLSGVAMEGEATAAIMKNIRGFRYPGQNLPIMPLTVSRDYWENGLNGSVDEWAWDSGTETITSGADGIPEIVLFPQNVNSAGNFGTVNIGIDANSTNYIGKQIRNGLRESDLAYHGGTLELDDDGELMLGGNPGLSASLTDDLKAIAGETRIIPLYDWVNGEGGDNSQFRIVRFVGVRVMNVALTGGGQGVSIQPADVILDHGLIPGSGSSSGSSQIYSTPRLVR